MIAMSISCKKETDDNNSNSSGNGNSNSNTNTKIAVYVKINADSGNFSQNPVDINQEFKMNESTYFAEYLGNKVATKFRIIGSSSSGNVDAEFYANGSNSSMSTMVVDHANGTSNNLLFLNSNLGLTIKINFPLYSSVSYTKYEASGGIIEGTLSGDNFQFEEKYNTNSSQNTTYQSKSKIKFKVIRK